MENSTFDEIQRSAANLLAKFHIHTYENELKSDFIAENTNEVLVEEEEESSDQVISKDKKKAEEQNEETNQIVPKDYYEKFGFEKNPFVVDVPRKDVAQLLVGMDTEMNKIKDFVVQESKFATIIGPLGTGKSTILNYILETANNNYDQVTPIYIYGTSSLTQDDLHESLSKPFLNFFTKNSWKRQTKATFIQYLMRIKKDDFLLILIDEAQDLHKSIFEFIRQLTQERKIGLIIAGTEQVAESIMPSLYDRSSTADGRMLDIRLGYLTLDQTRDLIEKRVADAGSAGIGPFSENDVKWIHNRSKGRARGVILESSQLLLSKYKEEEFGTPVKKAVTKEQTVDVVEPEVEALSMPLIKKVLTKSQLKALYAVSDFENSSADELAKETSMKLGTLKQSLKVLLGTASKAKIAGTPLGKHMPLIERHGSTKSSTYSVHPAIKSLLAKR